MDFKDKKVAVLGLGVEGRDAVRFLVERGALVTGFDQKPKTELEAKLDQPFFEKISLKLGSDYLKDGLTEFDLIVRSPGIKPSTPEIVEAIEKGARLTSPTRLFFALCPAPIIGVTGTKGKGTTSTLIAQMLSHQGFRSHLVGNIGRPALGELDQIEEKDWVVYELSSFQLQDLDQGPQISVVLFIATDHLDYHATREEYVKAKSQLVRHQSDQGFKIVNLDDETATSFGSLGAAKAVGFSRADSKAQAFVQEGKLILNYEGKREVVGRVDEVGLLGEHNWDNLLAASLAARLAGCELKPIAHVVKTFTGLPHRLERVAQLDEIEFVNDSFSTTPETAIAAIRSFPDRPVALIVGGSDKGADFGQLGQEIAGSTVEVLVPIGQMGPKILAKAQESGFKGQVVQGVEGMFGAVQKAFTAIMPEGVVLLSPACASFDMFANYYERGELFKEAVETITHGQTATA